MNPDDLDSMKARIAELEELQEELWDYLTTVASGSDLSRSAEHRRAWVIWGMDPRVDCDIEGCLDCEYWARRLGPIQHYQGGCSSQQPGGTCDCYVSQIPELVERWKDSHD